MVQWADDKFGTNLHLLSLGPDHLINLRGPRQMKLQEPEVGLGRVWVLVSGLLQVDPTGFQTGSRRKNNSELTRVKIL